MARNAVPKFRIKAVTNLSSSFKATAHENRWILTRFLLETKPNKWCSSCMDQRWAFTLVELLVVIALIAILAALLLPTLGHAKDRAYIATDVNNQRQLLIATHMYTADENDYLPRPGWKIPYSNWAYGDAFPYATGNYQAVIADQLAAVAKGQLYQYFTVPKILMCPADRRDAMFEQREMYISSYIWNGAVSSYDTSSARTHKVSQFRAADILQWESDEMNIASFNDGANMPYEGFTRRHGGRRTADPNDDVTAKAIISMFDSSVRPMKLGDLAPMAGKLGAYAAAPPVLPAVLPNDLWCNPDATNGMASSF